MRSGSETFFILWHLGKSHWVYVLCTLHELEPVLLRKFFDINFAKDSSRDRKFFEMTAPIAMGLDSALGSALIAVANKNGWAEPVAEESVRKELADTKRLVAMYTCSH